MKKFLILTAVLCALVLCIGIVAPTHAPGHLLANADSSRSSFTPVDRIVGVPGGGVVGKPLMLIHTVLPEDATNQEINWNIVNAGGTGAVLGVNGLTATSVGIVTVRATIIDGLGVGANYTQEYKIQIFDASKFIPVTNIVGVPASGLVGTPLILTHTVLPENATCQEIDWVITEDGGTGAVHDTKGLTVTSAGTVTLIAIIGNGSAPGELFEKEFEIKFSNTVTDPDPDPDPDPDTYTLSVKSGAGAGSYSAGAEVTIKANKAPTGKVFDKWTGGDGGSFANANSATTTFTMPAKATTVTATYRKQIKLNTLVKPNPMYLIVGNSEKTTVKLKPTNATVTPKFTSNNKVIASVNADGVVTAHNPGKATITVKAGGKTKKFTVTVGKIAASIVKMDVPMTKIKRGKSVQLTVSTLPEIIFPATIAWKSSNTKIAKVSKNGIVKGLRKGKATITATAWNGVKTTCKVTVK